LLFEDDRRACGLCGSLVVPQEFATLASPFCDLSDDVVSRIVDKLTMMDYRGRLQAAGDDVSKHRLDHLLVTHLPNIRYLSGFTGSSAVLLVSGSGSILFTDGRYTEQAKEEVRDAKVVITTKQALPGAARWLERRRGSRTKALAVGIEGEHFTVADRGRLSGLLPKHVRLREAPALIERARMTKDNDELSLIRQAAKVGSQLFDTVLKAIHPEAREIEVAAKMEYAAREAGAERMSFETIIASGVRSALPHGRASDARIPAGGFVVCDFGVILHGYCSDRTRTVYVGSATADARRTYGAVLEAQQAAINAVQPGVSVGSVDQAARKVLQKNGLAKYFTHSTGHGVGLEIHEAPRVAKGQPELLRPGMVITVEPGVYLPGKWGVRIEDMVVVTEHGCEVLDPTQKEFIAI
jgi:Xaa-Pro aminopeptidase